MRDEFKNPITKAVHQLVEGICYHYGSLKIKEAETDEVLAITIWPHPGDAPLMVGKQGRTIKALEWLASRAGKLSHKPCYLSLEDGFSGNPKEPAGKIDLDLDVLKRLLAQWTQLVFDCPVGMEFRNGNGEIRVYLNPAKASPDDEIVIRALDSLFFQYGKSNGCVVYIKSTQNSD
ncbi:MAG TPA: hypothetical protein VFU31_30430 [Candidatus Binatia bacterium]|nr:hypothetical protein [Candidatus Binatia bacterium]